MELGEIVFINKNFIVRVIDIDWDNKTFLGKYIKGHRIIKKSFPIGNATKSYNENSKKCLKFKKKKNYEMDLDNLVPEYFPFLGYFKSDKDVLPDFVVKNLKGTENYLRVKDAEYDKRHEKIIDTITKNQSYMVRGMDYRTIENKNDIEFYSHNETCHHIRVCVKDKRYVNIDALNNLKTFTSVYIKGLYEEYRRASWRDMKVDLGDVIFIRYNGEIIEIKITSIIDRYDIEGYNLYDKERTIIKFCLLDRMIKN